MLVKDNGLLVQCHFANCPCSVLSWGQQEGRLPKCQRAQRITSLYPFSYRPRDVIKSPSWYDKGNNKSFHWTHGAT